MKKGIVAVGIFALFVVGATLLKAQSGSTVTFTNTAQNPCSRSGQCWVTPNPVPGGGTIFYSPVTGSQTVFNVWFEGTTPAVDVTHSNVTAIRTRLVEPSPTRPIPGCPTGALDKLEFPSQAVYDSAGAIEYYFSAEQYIGNYHYVASGGGRGGGSAGCYSSIMPAGTPLPDGTVTSGGFTSVTYPQ